MGEIFNLSTLCRCCHSDGGDRCFKRLNIAYSVDDGVEIYEIILQESLGIRILQPSMVTASYLICDICIQKLQIVSEFRQQVLKCEEKFKVYCLNEQFVSEGLVDNNLKPVEIKIEDNDNSDDDFPQDSGYVPDKTELESPLPVKIKREKITLEVDIKHPIEDIKIKNEGNEGYLKIENIEAINNNPVSNKNINSKIRPKSKIRPSAKIKSKSVIKRMKKKNPAIVYGNMRDEYSSVMATIKTNNETTYKCKICKRTASNTKELYNHIHSKHRETFKCIHCGKDFKIKKYLQQHLKIHNGAHQCCYCGTQFKNHKLKHTHEMGHLNKNNIYECDICQKVFKCKSTITKHIRTHEASNKIHVCDQCGWSFHQRSNLEAHIQCVHLKLRPHVCTVCKKTYTTTKNLKSHMKSHEINYKPESGRYRCDQCPGLFSSLKRFKKHKLAHENKYLCRYCPIVCEGKAEFNNHIEYHKETSDAIHNCSLCGKVFMTGYSLNRHIDIIHGGNKRFICDFCGLKFSQKSLVQRHIRRKHENAGENSLAEKGLEKTKCPICKRLFIDVEKHLKNHEDERKTCVCNICGNGYITNSALNRHKSQKHYGRSFDCEVCGKKYVKKKSLQNHRFKIHNSMVKNEVVERNDEVEILIP